MIDNIINLAHESKELVNLNRLTRIHFQPRVLSKISKISYLISSKLTKIVIFTTH